MPGSGARQEEHLGWRYTVEDGDCPMSPGFGKSERVPRGPGGAAPAPVGPAGSVGPTGGIGNLDVEATAGCGCGPVFSARVSTGGFQ